MDFKQTYKKCESQIIDYCLAHNYSYEKLKHMTKGMSKEFMAFQYFDGIENDLGLKDDKTIMPVVLWVYFNNDGKLTFKETEHTKKYIMN